MHGYLDTADHLNARQFLIAVKKLADTLSYGTDKSPFLGSGIEYAQSRPYEWGDPVRSIDWRVTARTGLKPAPRSRMITPCTSAVNELENPAGP